MPLRRADVHAQHLAPAVAGHADGAQPIVPDWGRLDALLGVGDDELDALQAKADELAQEPGPEGLRAPLRPSGAASPTSSAPGSRSSPCRWTRRRSTCSPTWTSRPGIARSSPNPLERLNGEIKRRTQVVGILPNEAAITRLVGAILLQQHDDWADLGRRYMTLETCPTFGDDRPVGLSTRLPGPAHAGGAS